MSTIPATTPTVLKEQLSMMLATALGSGRGLLTVPILVLVPQVMVRKRLDVASAARRWEDKVLGLVVGHWVDGR